MLVAALATSLLAGCGKNKKTEVDNTETQKCCGINRHRGI